MSCCQHPQKPHVSRKTALAKLPIHSGHAKMSFQVRLASHVSSVQHIAFIDVPSHKSALRHPYSTSWIKRFHFSFYTLHIYPSHLGYCGLNRVLCCELESKNMAIKAICLMLKDHSIEIHFFAWYKHFFYYTLRPLKYLLFHTYESLSWVATIYETHF